MDRTGNYSKHRKYQHIQLKKMLNCLDLHITILQKNDIETGAYFKEEFIKLREITDEILLRLD